MTGRAFITTGHLNGKTNLGLCSIGRFIASLDPPRAANVTVGGVSRLALVEEDQIREAAMSDSSIVVLATLDTKGHEAQYLREQIEKMGDRALIVDVGVVGTPAARADITREEVAEAGGTPLAVLLEKPDREVAAPIMADGATKVVSGLATEGKVHGILAMGGTQGTTLATKVMRALPYGFPKVMVSTMASGNVAPWVDIKDITMMFSVTDILGLNPVTRKILANAAGALCVTRPGAQQSIPWRKELEKFLNTRQSVSGI